MTHREDSKCLQDGKEQDRMSKTILKMEDIRKVFPGVVALDRISFDLKEGEIHALLGENGAGKSTLIKILGGIYTPDAGRIYIDGQEVKIEGVQDARKHKISIIHQELCLAPNMTVAENIFLGRMDCGPLGLVKDKTITEKTRKILDEFGLENLSPGMKVGELTTAQQQMVEIAKALSVDSRIIVMDEPTSSLAEKEVRKLFEFIRTLKERNISVIYISHRLEEIFEICDTITVIRDGQYVGASAVEDTDNEALMSMMVGREFKDVFPPKETAHGKEILRVENLSGAEGPQNVDFNLYENEILGFYGLIGSGRTEIMRMLFGVDAIKEGKIILEGREITIKCPRDAIEAGIALAPESRKEEGLVLIQDIDYNITLVILKELIKGIHLDKKKNDDIVSSYGEKLKIKTPSYHQKVVNLSGGNQQKVVLAKWLAARPKVLILDEPTRGIDVGAKQEIYQLIAKLAKTGVGIILVSSELPEIVGLSHRVIIMRELRQAGTLSQQEITQERIIKYALEG